MLKFVKIGLDRMLGSCNLPTKKKTEITYITILPVKSNRKTMKRYILIGKRFVGFSFIFLN